MWPRFPNVIIYEYIHRSLAVFVLHVDLTHYSVSQGLI